jgi:hypothetical protein
MQHQTAALHWLHLACLLGVCRQMEVLRRGIGPESIEDAVLIQPAEIPGMEPEAVEELER